MSRAFEWLERKRRTTNSFAEILAGVLFTSLHDDTRQLPFLRSIGEATGQLDKIQFNVALPDA